MSFMDSVKCKSLVLALGMVFGFTLSSTANAGMIPFFVPGTSSTTFSDSADSHRSTHFQALSTVTLTTLEAEIDPVNSSSLFSWQIFNSDASGVLGSVLFSSGNISFVDVGLDTYDTTVNASLNNLSYYILRLNMQANTVMQRYNESSQGLPLLTSDGNFMVLNGGGGFASSSSSNLGNSILPSFSVGTGATVPTPTTLALLGLGLAGLGLARRKKV